MVNLTKEAYDIINELSLEKELIVILKLKDGTNRLDLMLPDLRMINDDVRGHMLINYLFQLTEGYNFEIEYIQGLNHELVPIEFIKL